MHQSRTENGRSYARIVCCQESRLTSRTTHENVNSASDTLNVLDWINSWAFAVGKENARGERAVMSPTNSAASACPTMLPNVHSQSQPRGDL